ncbi:FAD-dependent oxidoreductase [Phaeobacter sp. CNT1-3]|nr:FAD-dependent oxidoreductase [Phaeobacter sp. CNT1-3]
MICTVLGAGVAGLCAATVLAERGAEVRVIDPGLAQPASMLAGGMIAPFCEGESAPDLVVQVGQTAADWWQDRIGPITRRGTLVIAPSRDQVELDRFARATSGHVWSTPADLEPALEGRFARGLFFGAEAHMDPRAALRLLRTRAEGLGVTFVTDGDEVGQVIDCRGWAARDHLRDLRAVRGEMLLVDAPDVTLSRTLRLLHPRFPCYIVPRDEGRYMIGATMVESADSGPVTARAVMELLSAAYTVHPAFAEARVIEVSAGLRPAFADNIPVLRQLDGRFYLNGMYRHGFLMAPHLAEQLADTLMGGLQNAG